tara:strand:+ start:4848 stop:5279 length:432 start_codon:yes stop_codon:yes gene_type:complete
MALTFIKKRLRNANGSVSFVDDLLFPQGEAGQTRFAFMKCIQFSGSNAPQRMARFIQNYTNRDGSKGLPSSHIGATSPYIDGGNLFYIYYNDNASEAFTHVDEVGDGLTYADLAAAQAGQAAAVTANNTLIASIQGSDAGWRN